MEKWRLRLRCRNGEPIRTAAVTGCSFANLDGLSGNHAQSRFVMTGGRLDGLPQTSLNGNEKGRCGRFCIHVGYTSAGAMLARRAARAAGFRPGPRCLSRFANMMRKLAIAIALAVGVAMCGSALAAPVVSQTATKSATTKAPAHHKVAKHHHVASHKTAAHKHSKKSHNAKHAHKAHAAKVAKSGK
ncbi:MAG TPA: hypothetical protein VF271_06070 [Rhodanobacteraceae bacterium]